MCKILIVEDDLSIQALLHDFIQEAGYSVVLAAEEVSMYDLNQPAGGQITDFDKIEKTKAYTITFADYKLPYTLLLTIMKNKRYCCGVSKDML